MGMGPMTEPLRHMCRNPRCRSRLPQPVDNERRAFCTFGCHTAFYRKHCLVCEQPIQQPKGGGVRSLCKRAKCRSEYRRFPHVYDFPRAATKAFAETLAKSAKQSILALDPSPSPKNAKAMQETPIKWAFKSGAKSEQAWHWEEIAGLDGERRWLEHWLVDREGLVKARLISAGERLYTIRLSPGIDHGIPSPLDDAKRLAISLAVARLPLEPVLAARLAKINELPPDPPQHLLPHTATYLAGLAASTMVAEPASTLLPFESPPKQRNQLIVANAEIG
jgi:hypothetical protein